MRARRRECAEGTLAAMSFGGAARRLVQSSLSPNASNDWCVTNVSRGDAFRNVSLDLEVTATSVSLVCGIALLCVLLVTSCSAKCERHYAGRVSEHVVVMAAAIVLQALAYFISAFTPYFSPEEGPFVASNLPGWLCQVQGALYEFAVCVTVLQIGAMSFVTHQLVLNPMPVDELHRRHRVKIYLSVFGTAIVMAVLPLLVWAATGKTVAMYSANKNDMICYLSDCPRGLAVFAIALFGAVTLYSVVVWIQVLVAVSRMRSTRAIADNSTTVAFILRRLTFVAATAGYFLLAMG